MSKKLKQHAQEAGLLWHDKPPHFTGGGNPVDFPVNPNLPLEIFTEFLLDDVVQFIHYDYLRDYNVGSRESLLQALKNHFEVDP